MAEGKKKKMTAARKKELILKAKKKGDAKRALELKKGNAAAKKNRNEGMTDKEIKFRDAAYEQEEILREEEKRLKKAHTKGEKLDKESLKKAANRKKAKEARKKYKR